MLELIHKGGIVMYPIILLSIISLAIFIERLIMLRRERFVPKFFEAQLITALKKRAYDEALDMVKASSSSLSSIAASIINNRNLPLSRLSEVAEETGRGEMSKLDRFQQGLQTIVAVAPLLGLLGTVFGMITIFNVLALQGGGNAQQLSGGIAEALVTTAAGLIVAIPTQFFYHIVHVRAEVCAKELEDSSSRIMNIVVQEEGK